MNQSKTNTDNVKHGADLSTGDLSQAELFGSDSESDGKGFDQEEISPRIRIRKLSSSEEEEVLEAKKGMASLGRENADVRKIKKKIKIEKKFGLLAKMKED